MKIPLPWELNEAGDCAFLHLPQAGQQLSRSKLWLRLFSKLTEVSLISAEFMGEPKVFEPKLLVVREKLGEQHLMAVYVPVFEADESSCAPDLCLRIGKVTLMSGYIHQDMKKLESSSPWQPEIVCKSIFVNASKHKELLCIVSKLENYFYAGMQLRRKPPGSNRNLEYLHIILHCDDLKINMSFDTTQLNDSVLEQYVIRLDDSFSKLKDVESIVPDHGSCRLSYHDSVMDDVRIDKMDGV